MRIRGGRLALVLALALVVSAPSTGAPTRAEAAPTDPSWRLFAEPPDVETLHLYDRARGRMLLISRTADTDNGPTVWAADLDTTLGWAPLVTSGQAPRFYEGSIPFLLGGVIDTRRDRAVVWGDGGSMGNGTWALSLSTLVWTQIVSSAYTLSGQCCAYDPIGDRVLVFGGSSGRICTVTSNALYELTLSGTPTWSQVVTDGPTPIGRRDAAMTYDPRRERMIMHGGQYLQSSCVGPWVPLDEAWELTLSLSGTPTWRFLPPAGTIPSGRFDEYVAADSLEDRLIAFGGFTSGVVPVADPLWTLSLAATDSARWTPHAIGGAPPARVPTDVVFDEHRRSLALGGGSVTEAGLYPRFVSLGGRLELAVDGTPAWNTRFADRKLPTANGPLVHDEERDRAVMVAMDYQAAVYGTIVWSTAIQSPTDWVVVSSGLPDRQNATVVADPVRDRVLIFGGTDQGVRTNAVLGVQLGSGSWSQLATQGTPPTVRQDAVGVYDPLGDRLLVFGGRNVVSGHNVDVSELWALSLAGTPTWVRLDASAPRPSARVLSSLMLDPAGNRLILFGGLDSVGASKKDLWEFSLTSNTWTAMAPRGTPPLWSVRDLVVCDPVRRRIMLVEDKPYPTPGEQLWVLPLADTTGWAQVTVPSLGPPSLSGRTGFFDTARDLLVENPVYRSESYLWALYMQDWTVPVTASVLRAEYVTGDVLLGWELSGVTGAILLERRVDSGAWSEYADVTLDLWNGRVYYSDWAVSPGHTYDYRLRVDIDGSVERVGLASVVVPPRPAVASLIVMPNPSGPNPGFYATLPDERTDARIDVYDISGRLVRSSGVYVDTRGTSGVFPYGSPGLRSGLYLARLVRDGRVMASTRFVVVR